MNSVVLKTVDYGRFMTPDGKNTELKRTRDRAIQIGLFAFSIDLSSAKTAPVIGNANLRYHISRLRQNAQDPPHAHADLHIRCLYRLE